jgi:PAS domain S-box-containing protein
MATAAKTKGLALPEARYKDLFQGLQDIVLLTTPSGDVMEINEVGIETLGYSGRAEALGTPVVRHYADPNDRNRLMSLLGENGSVKDFETRLLGKGGQEICVWISAQARRDNQGRILHCEKIIKDVTGHKKLEDELREKNRLLERYYLDLKKERDQFEEQAGMLGKAVAEANEAKRIVEEQNRKISVELDMAGKLQRSLLPKRYPEREGFHFSSKYLPSNRVGGDFFDIIELRDGNIGIVIADVSGHGPAAALLTTMFKMSFQMYAQELTSPSDVLGKLNREFCRLITTGEYITAFYLVLNPSEKKIIYAKAGHPYPMLYRRNTKTHKLLDADGFFIGMFEEAVFENMEIFLNYGDRLLLYTDGVIEARNPAGGSFEMSHVQRILAECDDLSGDALVDAIYRELLQFTQGDHFEDDLCMVLVSIGE